MKMSLMQTFSDNKVSTRHHKPSWKGLWMACDFNCPSQDFNSYLADLSLSLRSHANYKKIKGINMILFQASAGRKQGGFCSNISCSSHSRISLPAESSQVKMPALPPELKIKGIKMVLIERRTGVQLLPEHDPVRGGCGCGWRGSVRHLRRQVSSRWT